MITLPHSAEHVITSAWPGAREMAEYRAFLDAISRGDNAEADRLFDVWTDRMQELAAMGAYSEMLGGHHA